MPTRKVPVSWAEHSSDYISVILSTVPIDRTFSKLLSSMIFIFTNGYFTLSELIYMLIGLPSEWIEPSLCLLSLIFNYNPESLRSSFYGFSTLKLLKWLLDPVSLYCL